MSIGRQRTKQAITINHQTTTHRILTVVVAVCAITIPIAKAHTTEAAIIVFICSLSQTQTVSGPWTALLLLLERMNANDFARPCQNNGKFRVTSKFENPISTASYSKN